MHTVEPRIGDISLEKYVKKQPSEGEEVAERKYRLKQIERDGDIRSVSHFVQCI
jgi:hypothetical protein